MNDPQIVSGRGRLGYPILLGDLEGVDPALVIGKLSEAIADAGFATQRSQQVQVWRDEVGILKQAARELRSRLPMSGGWTVILEYEIPRRQKRPDAILLAADVVFVIEFKLGARDYDAASKWQVEEYALDLRDFHAESADRKLVPILCATQADESAPAALPGLPQVWPVCLTNAAGLGPVIADLFTRSHVEAREPINPACWLDSAYRPALTIIEAAEQLFSGHDVREISHSYADNLTATTDALVQSIQAAQLRGERRICFVTGVPGAGKTLAGLNAVHDPALRRDGKTGGVFLSGNGPLVKVVQESLVRSGRGRGANKRDASHEVSTFIQNVHTFLRFHGENPGQRPENIVVFDEAQRAWDSGQVKRKRGVNASEPETMLEVMERLPNWCVLVALVGGGQEIHQGEAGLSEWGRALARRPVPWVVMASADALAGGESVAGHRLFDHGIPDGLPILECPQLHLRVSVRSPRAQQFNEWVNDILSGRLQQAHHRIDQFAEFPMVLTRDLDAARLWLRQRSRLEPKHRCGLLASSGSVRHRAHGLELSTGFRQAYPYEHWFLAGPEDTRSSFALEVAATEFECQGLELDWTGVCWGSDMAIGADRDWEFRRFVGTRWQNVKDPLARVYMVNKYRVLLTRARQGLVIWIPSGDPSDPTRDPRPLDRTYEYLLHTGIRELPA